MNNTFSMDSPELQHHGILGMKWGVRRYQNADGSLTSAGRRRVQRAMQQRDRVMSTKEDRDYRYEYSKFRKITTKLTPAEINELVNRVERDEAMRKLTQVQTEDKFQKGMMYAREVLGLTTSAINTVGAVANTARTVTALKTDISNAPLNAMKLKADLESTKANTERTLANVKTLKAQAEDKEFSNMKAREDYNKEKQAAIDADYRQKVDNDNRKQEVFSKVDRDYSNYMNDVIRSSGAYAQSYVNSYDKSTTTNSSSFKQASSAGENYATQRLLPAVSSTPVLALPAVSSAPRVPTLDDLTKRK